MGKTVKSSFVEHQVFLGEGEYYLSAKVGTKYEYWRIVDINGLVTSSQVNSMDKVTMVDYWHDYLPLEVIQEVYDIMNDFYLIGDNIIESDNGVPF